MDILIIEDDPAVVAMLKAALARAGHAGVGAETAAAGLAAVEGRDLDLVILDLGLPDQDGMELIGALRAMRVTVPILVLSGRGDAAERSRALFAGADDYLVKPCDLRELQARVDALTRRTRRAAPSRAETGGLRLDKSKNRLEVEGVDILLTVSESEILELMISRPDRTVTREAILARLYSDAPDEPARKVVDVFVCKLRDKLVRAGLPRALIATDRSAGYRLAPEALSAAAASDEPARLLQ